MAELNINNRTIFCHDNLEVLRGTNSDCVDLIYLDPPFNKNKVFTAPIGSDAKGAEFSDIFREKDVKDEWLKTIKEDLPQLYDFLGGVRAIGNIYNYCYLAYMAIRLIEMHRVLKDSGSIYLHCDTTMSHYLKIVMDCVFDERNFRNEVVWCYRKWTNTAKYYQKNHDLILFYSKTKDYYFDKPLGELTNSMVQIRTRGYNAGTQNGRKILRIYDRDNPNAIKKINSGKYKDDEIYYIDEPAIGAPIPDYWDISILSGSSKERTGYPTQKPLALIERIIKASSNEGDMVLDPFCGCATTCIAAEKLGRKWIGVDISKEAIKQVNKRAAKEIAPDLWSEREVFDLIRPPERTDGGQDYQGKKYLYVISNPKHQGQYKVGIAKDAKARLNQYQMGNSKRAYKLEFTLLTPQFRALEMQVHNSPKFTAAHEWLTADLNKLTAEIKRLDKKLATGPVASHN